VKTLGYAKWYALNAYPLYIMQEPGMTVTCPEWLVIEAALEGNTGTLTVENTKDERDYIYFMKDEKINYTRQDKQDLELRIERMGSIYAHETRSATVTCPYDFDEAKVFVNSYLVETLYP
jgi:hypothetical protein